MGIAGNASSTKCCLADCHARGLTPDREAIERSLIALREAIAVRGGQRRARPYVERELRRLGVAAG